uniref:Uncharacterized protein n=1 Tax=Romanomermis culicivorax TaxID=13658 RepID=A0A915KQA3_ROMCU
MYVQVGTKIQEMGKQIYDVHRKMYAFIRTIVNKNKYLHLIKREAFWCILESQKLEILQRFA